MSSTPYFKLYFSDLAGDTLFLSDAEFGSYVLLLGAMWNAGGELNFDHSLLGRIARVSPAKWPKRWVSLEGFFIVRGGRVSHKRLTAERKKVDEISSVNSDNGKAGVEAKRRKRLIADPASALVSLERNASHTRVHSQRTPRAPQGGTELPEFQGPENVKAIVHRELGEVGERILRAFTWRDVPTKALVTTTQTMRSKLAPCEAALMAVGVPLLVEKANAA